MMKLEEILNGIHVAEIKGNITKEISGLEIDSRKIESGHMFVAVRGCGHGTTSFFRGLYLSYQRNSALTRKKNVANLSKVCYILNEHYLV